MCVSEKKKGGGVKSLSGKDDRNKKEFKKITGCIHIELDGSHGQEEAGSLTSQPAFLFTAVKWFMHNMIMCV